MPSDDIFIQPPNIGTSPPSAPLPPAGGGEEPLNLSWAPPPGMIGLSIKNFLLKIVTLGIYGFWGKTEVRRRIWSAARLNGEPLQYTGTGKELFLGFLIVFGVFFLPILLGGMAIGVLAGPKSPLLAVFQVVIYVVSFFLIGVAIHRAQRYRLSRTNWRGIRGGLDGSSRSYAWTHFWTALVTLLSLGWASPWRSTKLQGLITNGMRFGDRPFRFAAPAGPLYKPFAVLWISGLVILVLVGFAMQGFITYLMASGQIPRPRAGRPPDMGQIMGLVLAFYAIAILGFLAYGVVSAWYRAKMMNHFAAHTTFENARFAGTATGRSLIWLTFTNALMVLFTLGLLSPVAQARSARYFVQRLSISGTAPLSAIAQRAHDDLKRGEGLAQVFDVDAFYVPAVFAGRFSDGKTAGSTASEVRLSEGGVSISLPGAAEPLVWPFAALGVAAPLTAKSSDVLLTYSYMPGATLFVADREFVRAVVKHAPQLTAASFGWRAARPWMIAAAVLILAFAASWAVDFSPAKAVARLMPDTVRTTIGAKVMQAMVGERRECREAAGRAALDRLVARLEKTSASSSRFNVRVLDWGLVNAFAVPGEQIVLTRGIITQAKSSDEVAGVLAHEMGHGIELHPESSLVRMIGLSAALELMMGGGGGTLANVGLLITQLSYTRSAEREADRHAVELLQRAGISARGLAAFFERTSETEKTFGASDFNVLRTHPQSRERAEAIAARPTYPATPAMSAEDWRALRAICSVKS